jgi:phosphotriesterase-related protein
MDICTNSQLASFDGHGFGHLLSAFVPMLREEGLSRDVVDTILITNPRRILAFPAAA